jgi:hypothetical protein
LIKSFNSKPLVFLKLGALLFLPIPLFFIPVSFLDTLPGICIYKNLTGKECPGCGMTHSVLSVFHFDFIGAFFYNKLIVVIFPLMLYLWIKIIAGEYKKFRNPL